MLFSFPLQPPVPPYDYVEPSATNDYDQLNFNENQLGCHSGQHDKWPSKIVAWVLSQAIASLYLN